MLAVPMLQVSPTDSSQDSRQYWGIPTPKGRSSSSQDFLIQRRPSVAVEYSHIPPATFKSTSPRGHSGARPVSPPSLSQSYGSSAGQQQPAQPQFSQQQVWHRLPAAAEMRVLSTEQQHSVLAAQGQPQRQAFPADLTLQVPSPGNSLDMGGGYRPANTAQSQPAGAGAGQPQPYGTSNPYAMQPTMGGMHSAVGHSMNAAMRPGTPTQSAPQATGMLVDASQVVQQAELPPPPQQQHQMAGAPPGTTINFHDSNVLMGSPLGRSGAFPKHVSFADDGERQSTASQAAAYAPSGAMPPAAAAPYQTYSITPAPYAMPPSRLQPPPPPPSQPPRAPPPPFPLDDSSDDEDETGTRAVRCYPRAPPPPPSVPPRPPMDPVSPFESAARIPSTSLNSTALGDYMLRGSVSQRLSSGGYSDTFNSYSASTDQLASPKASAPATRTFTKAPPSLMTAPVSDQKLRSFAPGQMTAVPAQSQSQAAQPPWVLSASAPPGAPPAGGASVFRRSKESPASSYDASTGSLPAPSGQLGGATQPLAAQPMGQQQTGVPQLSSHLLSTSQQSTASAQATTAQPTGHYQSLATTQHPEASQSAVFRKAPSQSSSLAGGNSGSLASSPSGQAASSVFKRVSSTSPNASQEWQAAQQQALGPGYNPAASAQQPQYASAPASQPPAPQQYQQQPGTYQQQPAAYQQQQVSSTSPTVSQDWQTAQQQVSGPGYNPAAPAQQPQYVSAPVAQSPQYYQQQPATYQQQQASSTSPTASQDWQNAQQQVPGLGYDPAVSVQQPQYVSAPASQPPLPQQYQQQPATYQTVQVTPAVYGTQPAALQAPVQAALQPGSQPNSQVPLQGADPRTAQYLQSGPTYQMIELRQPGSQPATQAPLQGANPGMAQSPHSGPTYQMIELNQSPPRAAEQPATQSLQASNASQPHMPPAPAAAQPPPATTALALPPASAAAQPPAATAAPALPPPPAQATPAFFVAQRWLDAKHGLEVILDARYTDPSLDSVAYQVTAYTCKDRHAGTPANVFIELIGDSGSSGPQRLGATATTPGGDLFETGQHASFAVRCKYLGQLRTLKVWMADHAQPWKMDRIQVRIETHACQGH